MKKTEMAKVLTIKAILPNGYMLVLVTACKPYATAKMILEQYGVKARIKSCKETAAMPLLIALVYSAFARMKNRITNCIRYC